MSVNVRVVNVMAGYKVHPVITSSDVNAGNIPGNSREYSREIKEKRGIPGNIPVDNINAREFYRDFTGILPGTSQLKIA